MDKKKKKGHWSSAYLKRINSTEITIRRESSTQTKKTVRKERISTDPVFSRCTEIECEPRTPDRILYTPEKKPRYITPNRNLSIPQTPNAAPPETGFSSRAKRRLFW